MTKKSNKVSETMENAQLMLICKSMEENDKKERLRREMNTVRLYNNVGVSITRKFM